MNPNYAQKLGLKIQKTNVGAQKIDGFALETFKRVIVNFQIENKANKPKFFQKTFLIADTKFEVILKISNADVLFSKKKIL